MIGKTAVMQPWLCGERSKGSEEARQKVWPVSVGFRATAQPAACLRKAGHKDRGWEETAAVRVQGDD